LKLGSPFIHPDYLLECLTGEQFKEWQMFAELEPWGYNEKDLQESFTRYSTAASQGVKKKSGADLLQSDYSLEHFREEQKKKRKKGGKQDAEEMKQTLLFLLPTAKKEK